MFKNVLVPKSRYFGTMVQLVQESPTLPYQKDFPVNCTNSVGLESVILD